MASDTIFRQLDHLVNVNKESEAGYRAAADKVRNTELQTLFMGYADQHHHFAAELEQELERMGGRLSDSGMTTGVFNRSWMDIKAALSGHSAISLLKSCADAEESAESAYLDVADTNPTGQTHKLVDKHLEQMKGFRTRLRRLASEGKDGLEFPKNA